MRFAAYCDSQMQLHHSTIKLYLCGVRFYYIKYSLFNHLVKDGKTLECLKTTLVGIKKKQGSTSKRLRLLDYLQEGVSKSIGSRKTFCHQTMIPLNIAMRH